MTAYQKVPHPLLNIAEWRKGCSCAIGGAPGQCETCTGGLINAIETWFQQQEKQRVPLSDQLPQGFLSDVLTAAGLVRHGKQCKQLAERIGVAVEKIWVTSMGQRSGITQEKQGMDAQELLAALGDLSFACFGGIGTKAPDAATYNRTFAVLQKHRDAAQAKQGGV